MLIKTTLISAVAAIGLTGAAAADGVKGPSLLTDETMDTIIAGSTISSWGHLYYAKKDPTEVGVEDLYQKLKKGLDSTSPVESADMSRRFLSTIRLAILVV